MAINEPLLRECIAQIEREPEHWFQGTFESRAEATNAWQGLNNADASSKCGTTRCLAGWAIMLTYPELDSIYDLSTDPATEAGELLGLSEDQIDELFISSLGIHDLEEFKRYITARTGVEFKEQVS